MTTTPDSAEFLGYDETLARLLGGQRLVVFRDDCGSVTHCRLVGFDAPVSVAAFGELRDQGTVAEVGNNQWGIHPRRRVAIRRLNGLAKSYKLNL
jgi:hypothetical protein